MSLTAPDPNPNSPRSLGEAQRPVSWFGLRTLARSAKEASAATQFARFADARQAQAAVAPANAYDLAGEAVGRAFVMDYVADTGDGYDATFAIARSVDGSMTESEDPGGNAPIDRADLLVLGGDQVYPFASVAAYDERLSRPFADAVRPIDGKGYLVALPGNHDWYDGLNQFRRNFCESFLRRMTEDGLPDAFVETPHPGLADPLLDRWLFQSRSYFAVRLPHGWWLWGVDCQLDSYIDTAQLAYFTQARKLVGPQEKVIMCFPRPSWTDDAVLDDDHFVTNRQTVTWFVDRMFGVGVGHPGQVPILLSGDKHHFVHYTQTPGQSGDAAHAPRHLVTCGGGGAYLSSTHHSDEVLQIPWHPPDKSTTRYQRGTMYPSKWDSQLLRRGFLRTLVLNGPMFPALLMVVQLAMLVGFGLGERGHERAGVITLAASVLVVGLALIGFSVAFGRTLKPRWVGHCLSVVLGLLHTSAYVAIGWAFARQWPGVGGTTGDLLVPALLAAAVGPLVWATFMLVCDLGWIHWHENEFFAGMRYGSYKSHLRIAIAPPEVEGAAGQMTVAVHTIRAPKKNRKRMADERESSEVGRLYSFSVLGD